MEDVGMHLRDPPHIVPGIFHDHAHRRPQSTVCSGSQLLHLGSYWLRFLLGRQLQLQLPHPVVLYIGDVQRHDGDHVELYGFLQR